MPRTVIYDAVRTPFGRVGGALAGVRPDDLAAAVVAAVVGRLGVDASRVDDVILGAANQSGEDSRNVARIAALLAELPTSVPGVTLNRLCGSSLDAVIQGSRAIDSGDAELVVAGGVESMSRAPFVVERSAASWPSLGNQTLWSTALESRMPNPAFPPEWAIPGVESADLVADLYRIPREAQDAFALRSHRRAAEAWRAGTFDTEIVQVVGKRLERDEGIHADARAGAIEWAHPLLESGGTVTAGNAAPSGDGAAAVLLGADGALPAEPLCRITGRGVSGEDPDIYGVAPVLAAERALRRAGRSWADVDVVELDEAFAAHSLACLSRWPDLDPERLNVHGGAIAIGHPLGAAGARLVSRAAHHLARRGSGVAVVAMCVSAGQGLAIVLER